MLTLNPGDTVKIDSGARAGDIYQYLGQPVTVPFNYTAGTSSPSQVMPGQNVLVPAGTDGATANTVYQYVGALPLSNPNLATQNYAGPAVSFGGTLTNGSSTVTGISSTKGLVVGELVSDPDNDIPAGTTIQSINSSSGTITLSAPATVSGSGSVTENLVASPSWHQITALQSDYSNPSLWRQINVNSDPLQVEAYVVNSGVSAATTYTLTADSNQTINALVLALSAAVAGSGGSGVSVSGSGVYTGNVISTDVQAFQDGDGSGPGAGVHAASVSFSAGDTSSITANAAAASLAASLAGGTAVSVSIGISVALNQINNDVEAYIANATTGVFTTSGGISLSSDGKRHHRRHLHRRLAGRLFRRRCRRRHQRRRRRRHQRHPRPGQRLRLRQQAHSAAAITFTTQDKSDIDAIITAASVGVGVGNNGVGASIGIAVAQNFIGYDPSGNYLPLQVEAYALNTSIQAAGAYTLTATSQQTINAITTAGSVAVAGGVRGRGALRLGRLHAKRDGRQCSGVPERRRHGSGAGIHAASVAFTATDGGGAYNLQLVNWGNGSGVPTSGKNLVIVGIDSSGLLHIRIFGANGNLLTDTDET